MVRLIQGRQPRVILEIGTRSGGTLFAWVRASQAAELVISVDLPEGRFGGGYDERRTRLYREFAADRPQTRMGMLRVDSHSEETLRTVKQLLAGRTIDFLFIDGDHTYAGVRRDYENVRPPRDERRPHRIPRYPDVRTGTRSAAALARTQGGRRLGRDRVQARSPRHRSDPEGRGVAPALVLERSPFTAGGSQLLAEGSGKALRLLVIGITWPPETFLRRKLEGLARLGFRVTAAVPKHSTRVRRGRRYVPRGRSDGPVDTDDRRHRADAADGARRSARSDGFRRCPANEREPPAERAGVAGRAVRHCPLRVELRGDRLPAVSAPLEGPDRHQLPRDAGLHPPVRHAGIFRAVEAELRGGGGRALRLPMRSRPRRHCSDSIRRRPS